MNIEAIGSTNERSAVPKPVKIASWGHLAGLLLIMAATTAWGFHVQSVGMGDPSSHQLATHIHSIQFYLLSIAADLALLFYCWYGVHRHRNTDALRTLFGARRTSVKTVAIDLAIALLFWVLWEATADATWRMLGPDVGRSVNSLLPTSPMAVSLWIVCSINAGYCEELINRGYLQRQFHALTGSVSAAVLTQALVFGLMHSYLGWRHVVVISILGLLYGTLAIWRKNLGANIIAHAWSDIWEGWLKFLV